MAVSGYATTRMLEASPFETAVVSLHYAFPAAVFGFYIISCSVAVSTLQCLRASNGPARPVLRRAIVGLLLFNICTYMAQLLAIVARAIALQTLPECKDTVIGLLSCVLVFGLEFAWLLDNEKPVFYPYIGSFCLALILEPIIQSLAFVSDSRMSVSYTRLADISAAAARCIAFASGVMIYLASSCRCAREKGTDSEREPLVKKNGEAPDGTASDSGSEQQEGYGSTTDSSDASTEASTDAGRTPVNDDAELPWERREREAKEKIEKRLKDKGNWFTYAKSFAVFFPFIWPVNKPRLQIRVLLVALCLLSMNFVNLLIPRQLGIIMDCLGGDSDRNVWAQVLVFAGLKLLASESGISLLRSWLWIPVEYHSYEAMNTAAYSHVLNLSCDFHDSKSSSDIMMAIQSGNQISNMLEAVCFRAVPMMIDMTVAFVYLSLIFGPYEGFITVATSCVFFYLTTRMMSSLKTARRSEVHAYFQEHYVRQAGIQGWSTVTSFNQTKHEEHRYSKAVNDRVNKSQSIYMKYVMAYAFQYLVLLCGLLAGAFLAVYEITHRDVTPGQFIMLLTYWAQLVAPLNFFSNLGKTISRDLIGAEQLLDIMTMKPSVVNKEDAKPLQFSGGMVRFNHVHFSYDKKKDILKDITFTADPGMTIAFVGTTGAGKSTTLKLLDRFYDVTQGSIQIDGQDIRDVELFSLRGQIGVVPQTPILFDDTIMNNVRYAKLSATDEEVFEACKAAAIHDQIVGFADGYNTRVGERGIKLSGGEMQRVAIARALLKKPSIVLLDEATSAVDTDTEQKIQEALRVLCQGRTTFIVAHRLSTIMNADRIIVIGGGEKIEEGTHEELIAANGKYADLWAKQIFVKPKDKKHDKGAAAKDAEADKTPARKASGIVNDLSHEETTNELAKVNSKKAEARADAAAQTPSKPSSGHKKEGSKLNPDAPTFTPRSKAAAMAAGRLAATPSSPTRLDRSGDGYFDSPEGRSPSPRGPGPAVPMYQPLQYLAAPFMMLPAPYTLYHAQGQRISAMPIAAGIPPSSLTAQHNDTRRARGPVEGPDRVGSGEQPSTSSAASNSRRSSAASSSTASQQRKHHRERGGATSAASDRPGVELRYPRKPERRVQCKSEPSANNSACSQRGSDA